MPQTSLDIGSTVIRRLHRMVRHGFRPWLGYDVASGLDRDIQLRRKRIIATLHPDGAIAFSPVVSPFPDAVAGDDQEGFEALFPANTPNKRNLMRRLYEIGL